MAKLYFRYGAMGASKTSNALMVEYNYFERGQNAVIFKPSIDTRDGIDIVKSRVGLAKKAYLIAPGDDVDFFFVADFVHNGLDTDTATTNEGADWVNARNGRGNSDFCSASSLASDTADFDGAVFNFWNFLAEETFNEFC